MAIRVLDTATGAVFTFPITPQQVDLSYNGKFVELDLVGGPAKIPNGKELTEVTFNGLLPGANRGAAPYIGEFVSPLVASALLKKWAADGVKLRLTIEGTDFDDAVYLQSCRLAQGGGYGDLSYDVSFILAREIIVYTTAYNGSGRPESTTPARITYTSSKNDTLYSIAQKVYGDGKKWGQIYNANTNLIKNKSQKLPAGLVLVIP